MLNGYSHVHHDQAVETMERIHRRVALERAVKGLKRLARRASRRGAHPTRTVLAAATSPPAAAIVAVSEAVVKPAR